MRDKTKKENLKMLSNILEKGKMSKDLRKAVLEIQKAVKQNNTSLVAELSSVKSLISGVLRSKEKHFYEFYPYRESHYSNEKHMGDSIYSLLDHLHHESSFKLDKIPSGMIVINGNGITETEHTDNSKNPIVKKINYEFSQTPIRCGIKMKERKKKKRLQK